MSSGLLAGLHRVKHQTGILNILARLGGEHEIGVEGGVPASQETGLDLSILSETGLADLLLGQSILLQRIGERVLTLSALCEGLRTGKRSAGDGMVESLGLGLGGRRSSQGGLRLGRGASLRQELNLLVDGAAEIIEGLADVGRVVVGLVGVLRAVERWRRSVAVGSKRPCGIACQVSWSALTSPAKASGGQA